MPHPLVSGSASTSSRCWSGGWMGVLSTSRETAVVLRCHGSPRCIPASCSHPCAAPTFTKDFDVTGGGHLSERVWSRPVTVVSHELDNHMWEENQRAAAHPDALANVAKPRCILRSLCLPAQVSYSLIARAAWIPCRRRTHTSRASSEQTLLA